MARVTAEKKEATRHRLLEAAADEFARHGRQGASINRVSLAAGLAKGTVDNYFPSKDELFLAVCHEACARAVAGARLLPPDATTRERLLALARSDTQWAREHEGFARVLVCEALSGTRELALRIQRSAEPWFRAVTEVMERGALRGEIRQDVPSREFTLLFSGLLNLALTQSWASSGQWPRFEEIPRVVVRQFLEGAQPPPRSGTGRR